MHRLLRATAAPLLLAASLAAATPPAPVHTGQLGDHALKECSGFAASRRADHLLWSHNDSGGEPVLYALGTDGSPRGRLRLAGATNVDWEDLASFELDGHAYLLVADTGDNFARRTDCVCYVVAEPDPAALRRGAELTVEIAWRIPVRWPGGPRDCEAVAVDPATRTIWLLSKRTQPPGFYTLPLRPDARAAATLHAHPGPDATGFPTPTLGDFLSAAHSGKHRAYPTALDLSPDGRLAAVLTYGDVLLYRRAAAETWAAAFARAPEALAPHGLDQAEALCFARDGHALYVSSEGRSAPLLRYDLAPAGR